MSEAVMMDAVQRELWLRQLEALEEIYPTMFWVPNVVQEEVFRVWDGKWGSSRGGVRVYPYITMVTPGNGTGKTCAMVQDIAGCLLGPQYVNAEWVRVPYYDEIKALRDGGKFRSRIVCKAEDVKEMGSVYEEIKQWIPTAKFTSKASSGYFQKIEIPHPDNPNVKNIVDIKTFDQEKTAHAGSNLHRIWMNEPPPPEIFGEEIGRTRSKKGQVQCFVLIFATVLDQSGYLWDMLDDPELDGRIAHIEGCIWHNCADDEIPDNIAIKLGLKRDKNGKWITRGVLSRESIENQVATWKRTCPAEAEAREWGLPMHLSGRIWKTYDTQIHLVKRFPTPKKWPVIQVVDPHPSKPDFSGWFAISNLSELVAIHEWPFELFETIRSRDMTIDQTCAEWRRLEQEWGIAGQIVARYGDPNMFNSPDAKTLKSLKMLYADCGFNFNTNVMDDMEYGHRSVETLLYYDRERWVINSNDPRNKPKFLVIDECRNIDRAMQKYGYKANRDPTAAPSTQIEKKFACVAGVVRYAAVSFTQYAAEGVAYGGKEKLSDYERMRRGRDRFRDGSGGRRETIKSRRVISSMNY